MGRASQIRGLGELLKMPSGLLLLEYMTFLFWAQVTSKELLPRRELEATVMASSGTLLCSKSAVSCQTLVSTSTVPLTANLHVVRRGMRSNFPQKIADPPLMIPAYPPGLDLVTTTGQPSSRLSDLSKLGMQQNPPLAPASITVPSPGDNFTSNSNASSVPPSLAEPPISHHLGCCGENMVQRRGSRDCHCVYPVKVVLLLWNVSQASNWSNEFLEELASQLNLQVTQFEISNFYVVGLSGLNLTMNIAPFSGISFSADQAHTMNVALTLHEVVIDPGVVGGYKVLSFMWFEPPASSPAPVHAPLPKSPPPSMSYLHKPNFDVSGGSHRNLSIIVGICVGLLVVLVVAVLVICTCASGKGKKLQTRDIAKLKSVDAASVESALPHPTSTRFLAYEELKEATNNFEPASVLGEGGFGRVFKGVLSDGTAVAIKKLNNGGQQGDREFLVEVEMLSRLHHRSLVKLIGYYSSRNSSQNLLCYELVPNGSLEAWLHGPLGANCPLDWDTRMKISLDSARGLAYLHEDCQPSVIHRDFKASNILLENNFHAKVSDFGLAKQAPEGRANYLSTRVMGTFGYVAPEYAMTGHLLVKSDVYSYGVVLLELLTGRRPVDMSQPNGQENLVTWSRPILRDKDRLEEIADPKLMGKYPKEDFLRVCTIAAACVAPEASQRPTMGEVVQSLKMVQRLAEYQDTIPTPTAHPKVKQASSTYESDGTSSMFSSGPFSGLSGFDNDNISRTALFSEDLHEGR